MADVVINHRVGTSRGNGGMYNRYDGIPLSWDERAVTSCTGGLVTKFQLVCFFCRHVHKSTNLLKSHYFVICYCQGNKSTGDNFHGVPNIDHGQDFVRKDIVAWLKWLRQNVGFEDFRFDFARG